MHQHHHNDAYAPDIRLGVLLNSIINKDSDLAIVDDLDEYFSIEFHHWTATL